MNPKKAQRKRHPVLVFVLVLLTTLCLFGISFRVILLPPFTAFFAENTVNSPLSDLSHSELVEVAEMGRAYVVGDSGALLPEGEDERVAFTPEVVSHMEDVRAVIQDALILTVAFVILLLATLIYTGRKVGRQTLSVGLLFGGVSAVFVALVLSLIGVLNFESLFIAMHDMLFAEGNWIFSEDSLLICAYPLPFWIGMALAWALTLLLLSTIVSVLGLMLRQEKKHRSK